MRTGLIAEKVGMSRMFLETGQHVPVTLLKVDNCQVTAVRTEEKNGYSAVQLGIGKKKAKRVSKPLRGQYAKVKIEPKAKVAEFRVDNDNLLEVGAELSPTHFVPGQKVDVAGTTQGKGFSGVIKRHNFASQRASHGALKVHNQAGSTGQCQDPGRVFKGKKMAGQLGNKQRSQQNLEVVAVDEENGLLVIKGSIPGSKGTYVIVKDAAKKALPEEAPLPAGLKGANQSAPQEEAVEQPAEAPAEEAAPAAEVKEEAPVEEVKAEEAPAEAEAPAEEDKKE